MRLLAIAAVLLTGLAGVSMAGAPTPPAPRTFIMPPKAALVVGAIHEVELSPIFAEDFMCSQHWEGQIPYAGDALGSDCMITGGVEGDSGFSRPFRSDGRTNADWYGWHANVLSPTDGTVAGLFVKDVENVPGTMGNPPAGMLQIRRADGVIVLLAHVTDIAVIRGEPVKAGQVVAKVGNNGFARAPHIHIGAWREATAEPLQIRWDLRAMAKLRGD